VGENNQKGQICRSCGNLGISDLRLVNPLCEVNTEVSKHQSSVYVIIHSLIHDWMLMIGYTNRIHANLRIIHAIYYYHRQYTRV
jgi:tRNA C32,U32 (ribose-2'-O)-methylase TrmJ